MEEIIIHFDCTTNHYIVSFDNNGDQYNVEIQNSLTNQTIKRYLQTADKLNANTAQDEYGSYDMSCRKVRLTGLIAETIKQIALTEQELHKYGK